MDSIFPFLTPFEFYAALVIGLCAGFVKGVVGFALPLILISGLTTFMAPELALAGLILPTVLANAFQALRQGPNAALRTIRMFWIFLLCGAAAMTITAQLVQSVPQSLLLLLIGGPVVFFTLLQLSKYKFHLPRRSGRVEALVGGFAGAIGGLSGVWGPPTVAYLTALGTDKHDQMRIQGVIYGLGAMALLGAHLGSGVLNAQTWPFSALLLAPVMLGVWLGGKVMDRVDPVLFRKMTLVVLLLAGLNLIRRALF
ncbi:sulfite exporter TauE/SafE family protein [Sulfitobacter sp. PS-8MA]|uniref:sulfite exporter TauE/SafE family protein n=1 Tax=Sulfitobacter sp. PS-8MA TaxID=3237707 RepID=UPI0034C5F03C